MYIDIYILYGGMTSLSNEDDTCSICFEFKADSKCNVEGICCGRNDSQHFVCKDCIIKVGILTSYCCNTNIS